MTGFQHFTETFSNYNLCYYSIPEQPYGWFCGCHKCLSHTQCVWSNEKIEALCSCCSLQKHLEWWPAALYKTGWSALMLLKESRILRIELNTICLYQHYSLSMPNTLQYTWCADYCKWVQPAQLPHINWSLSSVPLGTTFMIRSPLRPRRVRLHVPNPQHGSNHCLSFSTLHYFNSDMLSVHNSYATKAIIKA